MKLRYLAPNLVTTIGLLFGLASIVAVLDSRFVDGAWLIVWAVLVDRADGAVARTLDASSDFGAQMDSFADFLNFGVAPAFLIFASLESIPELGFETGGKRVFLLVACVIWVLATAVRLARFNVAAVSGESAPVYFGVATTLAAGILVIWYLVLIKHSPENAPLGGVDLFRFPRLMGDWEVSTNVWNFMPGAMIFGAALMVSNLPIPKLGRMRTRSLTIIVAALTTVGYVCGIFRFFPEIMAVLPSGWVLISLVWGRVSERARSLEAPPWH